MGKVTSRVSQTKCKEAETNSNRVEDVLYLPYRHKSDPPVSKLREEGGGIGPIQGLYDS